MAKHHRIGKSQHSTHDGILRQLGLIGMDSIEPVVIASIATGSPLLLIGPHGTAKSLLLCRLCEALNLKWRHYNASLLNYDDLVGYPLPDDHGGLRFIQTPASIWDAEAVFLDEISRCRPDMQNRLFSIIHEKRVQGLPIERLVHRWAAMNPPVSERENDDTSANYLGSEPLDSALADRFNFVVEVPQWQSLSPDDREAVIVSSLDPVPTHVASALRDRVGRVRLELPSVESALGPAIAEYVRLICDHATTLGLAPSGRRGAMLYRNIIAVHAAQLVDRVTTRPSDSAWIAVQHSLPQRAEGATIDRARLLLAHDSAWSAVTMQKTDPRRPLTTERCAVRRAIMAISIEQLSATELSAYVADGLAEAPPGGRHALAAFVASAPAAARLNAAIAEHAAELHGLTIVAQSLMEVFDHGSTQDLAWKQVLTVLAGLSAEDPETPTTTNLLIGLFREKVIAKPDDVAVVLRSWSEVRRLCQPSCEGIREAA